MNKKKKKKKRKEKKLLDQFVRLGGEVWKDLMELKAQMLKLPQTDSQTGKQSAGLTHTGYQ